MNRVRAAEGIPDGAESPTGRGGTPATHRGDRPLPGFRRRVETRIPVIDGRRIPTPTNEVRRISFGRGIPAPWHSLHLVGVRTMFLARTRCSGWAWEAASVTPGRRSPTDDPVVVTGDRPCRVTVGSDEPSVHRPRGSLRLDSGPSPTGGPPVGESPPFPAQPAFSRQVLRRRRSNGGPGCVDR